MGLGRNDPCPCGSGRKFKNCCMYREAQHDVQGTLPFDTGRDLALRREVREAAAKEPVWQAEALPLMMLVAEKGSERPVLLFVTAGELVVHLDMRGRLGGEVTTVAEALERVLAATARTVGTWPETVQVRHAAVADALRPLLVARDVSVAAADSLPHLEEAARSLMQNMLGGAPWPPVCRTETWSAWELPRSLVAELFSAASDFWRAAPWRHASNLQAPRAHMPSGQEWTACILGNAGQEFGLALYSDADDLYERALDASPEEPFGGVLGRILSITFERLADMPDGASRELRIARWDVAGPAAYPTLMTVNTPGGGAAAEDVRDLVTLLRVLPSFVEQHRLALMREERTLEPCNPIDWLHDDTGVRFRYEGEGVQGDVEADTSPVDDVLAEMRPDLAAVMQQAVMEVGEDAGPDAILAAANRRLANVTRSYNQTPQPELGDLSPDQVRRLLDQTSWTDGAGAIRLRQDLPLSDVDGSSMLHATRIFLGYVAECGGLGATQAGNLKVAVVRALLERLDYGDVSRRTTEQDVWPVHEIRVLCQVSGLLQHRGARFELTMDGTELIAEAEAGRLYARLFETCFRTFNLEYGGVFEWPELQQQVAFTLYRLGQVAGGWRRADKLLDSVVLPYALEQAPETELVDLPTMLLERYVLGHLGAFGLVEPRRPKKANKPGMSQYRVTPLFRSFFVFRV